jgi:hypothetical protein
MSGDGARQTQVLISNLIRSLAHRVRTPLSVISNELEALRTVAPEVELDASRQRAAQIADDLKLLSRFARPLYDRVAFDISELLREVGREMKIQIDEYPGSFLTTGDRCCFKLALLSIIELLLLVDTNGAAAFGFSVEEIGDSSGALIVRCSAIPGASCSPASNWHGFSEFFNEQLHLDTFLPACIDSLLIAQGVSVSIAVQSGMEIRLHLPSRDEPSKCSNCR